MSIEVNGNRLSQLMIFRGRNLTRRSRQRPEAKASAGPARLTILSEEGRLSERRPSEDVRLSDEAHRSVRGERRRPGLGMNLGRHHTLRTGPEPYQHILTGTQLGHAKAAQRFHMHKNVGRALAAGQESEPAQPVEPFDLGPFEAGGGP